MHVVNACCIVKIQITSYYIIINCELDIWLSGCHDIILDTATVIGLISGSRPAATVISSLALPDRSFSVFLCGGHKEKRKKAVWQCETKSFLVNQNNSKNSNLSNFYTVCIVKKMGTYHGFRPVYPEKMIRITCSCMSKVYIAKVATSLTMYKSSSCRYINFSIN